MGSGLKGGVVPLALFDSLGDGVTLADDRGRIVYSNSAADRILGVPATGSPPEQWADYYGVFLPDGVTAFPADGYPLLRALRGEETNDVRMLIRNPSVPRGVLISATGRPLRDEDGRIHGASVVFREVPRPGAPIEALRRELEALKAQVAPPVAERVEAALRICDQLDG